MTRRDIDLVLAVACAIGLTTAIVASPTTLEARIGLGLPFLLFLPGYVLLAALFPSRSDLEFIQRIGLSLGLSLAIVPLTGIALSYSPWGVRLSTVLACVSFLIVLAAATALIRRRLLPADDAFGMRISAWRLQGSRFPAAAGIGVLALAPLSAIAGVGGYIIINAQDEGDRFTEFYVLGQSGLAEDYPNQIVRGRNAPVIVGIENHEGTDIAYRMTVRIDGHDAMSIDGPTLVDGQRWERAISLTTTHVGDNQKVEFLLYRGDESVPHRRLHLWLDVEGAPRGAFVTDVRPSPTPAPRPTPTPPAPAEVLAEREAPSPVAPPPPEVIPQPQIHIVAPGDYLSAIARRYGVALEQLIAANDVGDPDVIHPKQEILIPTGSASGQGE